MANTLAQRKWAEHSLQKLANSHRFRNSSALQGIDACLTEADAFPMTFAEIVVLATKPADVSVGRRTCVNLIERPSYDQHSDQSNQSDTNTDILFFHRNLLLS